MSGLITRGGSSLGTKFVLESESSRSDFQEEVGNILLRPPRYHLALELHTQNHFLRDQEMIFLKTLC